MFKSEKFKIIAMPSVEKWLNKSQCLQAMEDYSAVNKIEKETCTYMEGKEEKKPM